MKRQRELKVRRASLGTLQQAVGAMKGLSAHHILLTRKALEPVRTYRAGVERILQSTGAVLDVGEGPPGLVVLGGDMGFCGSHNARVAAAARRFRAEHGEGPTYCVGRRAALHLRRSGVGVQKTFAAPMGIEGAPNVLLELVQDVLGETLEARCCSFHIIGNEYLGVGRYEPKVTCLVPLARAQASDSAVVRYVQRHRLMMIAVRELLYSEMLEVLLNSMTSEHGARLEATQAAEEWLDRRVDDIDRTLTAVRREANTQEVIEIATGARMRGSL